MKKPVTYITETGLVWSVQIRDGFVDSNPKILSRVPRRWYYSCLNEVGLHYQELLENGTIKEKI